MKLEFSRYIFEKYSYTKFHEIPSGSIASRSMRADRETEVEKLTVAYGNFAKAPEYSLGMRPC